MYEEIRKSARAALLELLDVAALKPGTVDGRFLGFFTAAGAGTGEQRHGEKTSKNAIETFQNAIPSCYNNLVNVHDTRLAEDCQMPRTVLQWK